MKAIIYTRVSSVNQSTDRQLSELKAVEGFDVKKTFTESISGFTKSIYERPQLQKAISYARKNDIEAIMVHEISRLGRRTTEVLVLLDELKEAGIKVYVKSLGITINGGGINDAVNKLVITLLADLSRMESEQLSYRIKSGIAERKRKGLATGRKYGSRESRDKFLKKYSKVADLIEAGESIRYISIKCDVSPTTVQKVKNTLGELV